VNAAAAFNAELLRRYERPGPRYTSYPTVQQFSGAFGAAQLRAFAAQSNRTAGRPLSVYVHVPFCFSPCFYCGCNRLITRDLTKGDRYVEHLLHELEVVADLFAPGHEVVQLHLGGGTPNFLTPQALARLAVGLRRVFRLSETRERDFSIELDPRSVPEGYAALLADLGFNRISLGVQDFDPEVQAAVNRLQSIEQTLELIDVCRDGGMQSVNIDLIYGLPHQTPQAFKHTLRLVASARPDRIAVYGYAHLPRLFKAQRHIDPAALPTPAERLELLRLAIEELQASGYRYVGMDHFALPEDELVRAQENGTLQRNFMGYTTHANCDLLGLGISAISHVGDSYSQNHRDLHSWEAEINAGRLPVWRGLALSKDDRVRGEVIAQLMCQGEIEFAPLERRYGIDFGSYFRAALECLQMHVDDGLVRIEPQRLAVTPAGRLLVRSIAMCFDRYLQAPRQDEQARPFSAVV
jgi:oxygen-independent coproporphyrinogen-3 oxidase